VSQNEVNQRWLVLHPFQTWRRYFLRGLQSFA